MQGNILKKKTTKLNSQPVQYEKNKIDEDNSEKKIIKKKKKTMRGNTVVIYNVLKKNSKKNMWGKLKLNSQPTQY